MRTLRIVAVGLSGLLGQSTQAADVLTTPRPIPLTRPDMKFLLEDMKARKPRIPLPELTAEEKEKLGERGSNYESRVRALYMPEGTTQSFGFGTREVDPNVTLDYKFKTQLFWIVSRTNNCQYCLGHQESKLLAAGMTEDEIAALAVVGTDAAFAGIVIEAAARGPAVQCADRIGRQGTEAHCRDVENRGGIGLTAFIAADRDAMMLEAVDPRFPFAPVVTVAPMRDDIAHIGEAGAVAPRRAGRLGVRQARARQPLFQIGEDLVGNGEAERFDGEGTVFEGGAQRLAR